MRARVACCAPPPPPGAVLGGWAWSPRGAVVPPSSHSDVLCAVDVAILILILRIAAGCGCCGCGCGCRLRVCAPAAESTAVSNSMQYTTGDRGRRRAKPAALGTKGGAGAPLPALRRRQAPRWGRVAGWGWGPRGSLPGPAHLGPICEKSRFQDAKPALGSGLCSASKPPPHKPPGEPGAPEEPPSYRSWVP
jgi:hypothetical protein